MSVKVMNMVFERYPNGGGEMLLALSLADHAHDDGTRIYPSIAQLAQKTRQSERAVQYQLRRMEESGWLELANEGDGGRGRHRQYRISEAWMKGAELAPIGKGAEVAPTPEKGADSAPIDPRKGATGDAKGANDDVKGCKAFAPASNRHEPSEPSKEKKPPAVVVTRSELIVDGVSEEAVDEFIAHRRRRKAPITPLAWGGFKAEAVKAGWPIDAAVRKALARNWTGFEADWVAREARPGAAAAETPFQRSQREKATQWSGGLAGARPPQGGGTGDFIDMEAGDAAARRLG